MRLKSAWACIVNKDIDAAIKAAHAAGVAEERASSSMWADTVAAEVEAFAGGLVDAQ